jgi:hypothetical protein
MIPQSSLCCNGGEFASKMGAFKHEMSERLFRIRRSSTVVRAPRSDLSEDIGSLISS